MSNDQPFEGQPITINNKCLITGKPFSVTVRINDYIRWRDRETTAQEAFPYLSPSQREFLISGISPDGWDILYSDKAEDTTK